MSDRPVRLPLSPETLDTLERLRCTSPSKYFERLLKEAARHHVTSDQLEEFVHSRAKETAPEADELAGRKAALEGEIDDLARIDAVEYALRRGPTAKRYGISLKILDQEVEIVQASLRKEAFGKRPANRVRSVCTESGEAILDDICTFLRRFVVLSADQACVIALWIAHTHAFQVAETTPYLSITSPEKRSGKTRLLEVLEGLVNNPWYTGRVSAAVLVRKTDAESPTLLLDESDTAFNSSREYSEALRGVLNLGYRRGGKSSCCVGKGADLTARDFNVFSPKAIAGIGNLPDTVADRSLPITLKRRTKDAAVEDFRRREVGAPSGKLRGRISDWVAAHLKELEKARPEMPASLNDRQKDSTEILLAIADLANGEWPGKSRKSVNALCGQNISEESYGVLVLTDIRELFLKGESDRLASQQIAEDLAELEHRPWPEWSKGKPITPRQIARLLTPFGIAPSTMRTKTRIAKGYYLADFQDAFSRYLPPLSVTPLQPAESLTLGPEPTGYTDNAVTERKDQKLADIRTCNGVTGNMPEIATDQGRKDAFEERAAIIENDGGLTHEEAERRAREEIHLEMENGVGGAPRSP